MPKYRVIIREVADYEVEIEAANEEDAGTAAEKYFVQARDIREFPCTVHERDPELIEEIT